MDKKLKAKWVKALMSGKYKQGMDALRSDGKYCCLGVLAEIIRYEGIVSHTYILGNTPVPFSIQTELAGLNDEGIPFPVIAGFIQENL